MAQTRPPIPEGFHFVGYTGQPEKQDQEGQQRELPPIPEGFHFVGYTGQPEQQPEERRIGFLDRLGEGVREAFTGAERTTPDLEALDLIMDAPELNAMSMGAFKSGLGFLLTGDAERQKAIIESNFPDATFRQDEKGNYIVNLPSGEYALQKPGLDLTDIASTFVQGAISAPAAAAGRGYQGMQRARRIAGAQGAITTGMEATTEAAGGGFVPANVMTDALLTGTLEAAPQAVRTLSRRSEDEARAAQEAAVRAERARIESPLSPERQAAQEHAQRERLYQAVTEPKQKQLRDLPETMDIDPTRYEAAEVLGIPREHVPPSVAAQDQQFIELYQATASRVGSALNARQIEDIAVTQRAAENIITELGGTTDKAGLTIRARDRIQENIEDLAKQSDAMYDRLNQMIPGNTQVDVSEIRDSILERARSLTATGDIDKGIERLDPLRRKLLNALDPEDTTYAYLDIQRKEIGEAIGKKRGVYRDESSASLSEMYSLMTDAQGRAASTINPEAGGIWKQGKNLVSQRKTIEENSIAVLGKDLSNDIMSKLGRATERLGKGELKEFDKIMKALPTEMREEAVLTSLSTAFNRSGKAQGKLQFGDFVNFYSGLNKSPVAKKALLSNLPAGAEQRLDALFNLSKGWKRARDQYITTGKIQEAYKEFDVDNVVGKAFGSVTEEATNLATKAVDAATGISVAGNLVNALSKSKKEPFIESADKLFTSSEFINLVQSYSGDSTRAIQAQKKAARALERSESYKRWADLMPDDMKQELIRLGVLDYFRE